MKHGSKNPQMTQINADLGEEVGELICENFLNLWIVRRFSVVRLFLADPNSFRQIALTLLKGGKAEKLKS
jgi:hypothetical protein